MTCTECGCILVPAAHAGAICHSCYWGCLVHYLGWKAFVHKRQGLPAVSEEEEP